MIENGQFRKDLYYRIAVIKVKVPSLKDRPDDIIPLAKYFLVKFNKKFLKNITSLSAEAEQSLISHRWEGNVRELKNLIEKAVLTCIGQEITTENLGLNKVLNHAENPMNFGNKVNGIFFNPLEGEGVDLESIEQSLEVFYFKDALRLSGGNESRAARLLNLNHHTFRYRKRKLGM